MLEWIDILSAEPKLYINSQEKFRTKIGGFFSLLSGIAIFILAAYFIQEAFTRNNLTLIFNQTNLPNPMVNYTNQPMVITIQDQLGNPLPNANNRLFEIKAAFINYVSKDVNGAK